MSRDFRGGRQRLRAAIAVLSALVTLAGVLSVGAPAATAAPAAPPTTAPAPAAAQIVGSDFNAGFIISDQLFYQRGAMTQAQIQAFLDQKIGTCYNSNCLNVVKTTTYSRPASSNGVCDAYAGASNESAAAIIYKVQQACGISAKVLLVTLQKEQGLVTDDEPSAGELRIAMGYGCPDTAPCDAEFFGFYNQVYKAAWQFRRYSFPDYFGNFRPGTFSVLYNPNSGCGSLSVNIQNNATAALYNYTPYTPNAAALANLSGSAPPCGSYGNRNFWVYYNSWFGSSIAEDGAFAINAAYAASGGASGSLGAATQTLSCPLTASGCTQDFANGMIAWSRGNGAYPIYGAKAAHYRSIGAGSSVIGYPTTIDNPITGAVGAGSGQNFQRGQMLTGPAGTFAVQAAVQPAYNASGWVRGSLGWPTADGVCSGSNCTQSFQNGYVGVFPGGPLLMGASSTFTSAYRDAGGPSGVLGPVISTSNPVSSTNGAGVGQSFVNGQLLKTEAGTFALYGAVRDLHASLGWVRGYLGWPTSNLECEPSGDCAQTFQNGTIAVPAGRSPTVVVGSSDAVADLYRVMGGAGGILGVATSSVGTITGPQGDGIGQNFKNGQILSSASGTYALYGAIKTYQSANGWVRGAIGWPTGAQSCNPGGSCSQSFQGGTLYAPRAGGVYLVAVGAIDDAYRALGGAVGTLGMPLSNANPVDSPVGTGSGQSFTNGQILSSSAGTFAVFGAIRTYHAANGWVRGAIGWPTGDRACDSTGNCSQAFMGGTVYAPRAGGAYLVEAGSFADAYAAAGGPVGVLGLPASATNPITGANGPGRGQTFTGGQILQKDGGTAFAVTAGVLAAYSANGWVRGSVGWPTAAQVCVDDICTQMFQLGAVASTSSASYIVSGAAGAVYIAAGGPTGVLGAPRSGFNAISGAATPGSGQTFAGGQILTSASGTFAVYGTALTAYAADLWVRGALGWPISDRVCSTPDSCVQNFKGGYITIPASGPALVTHT